MTDDDKEVFESRLNALRESLKVVEDGDCAPYWECLRDCYNRSGHDCSARCAESFPGCAGRGVKEMVDTLYSKYRAHESLH